MRRPVGARFWADGTLYGFVQNIQGGIVVPIQEQLTAGTQIVWFAAFGTVRFSCATCTTSNEEKHH